jgi:excinuclease ABC subunit C
MVDEAGKVLYVGKAKNLKKRVTSYFKRQLDAKTLQLVRHIHSIEVTVTRNEREALLLENNLIKAEKPRYNILFRDDKSYPYLKLSNSPFPELSFHRGPKRGADKLYGPYPSARSAREALNLLQTIFRLRVCEDSYFKSRSRPCLQYQIKRCSGPCVGLVDEKEYQKDVLHARLFLEGKNQEVIEALIQKMEEFSQQHAFEKAAKVRDKIALLRGIQEQQIILSGQDNIDVLGISVHGDAACIHQLTIRSGRMVGSRQYFPNKTALISSDDKRKEVILQAFIFQHYGALIELGPLSFPKIILLPFSIPESQSIEAFFKEEKGISIEIIKAARGNRLRWVNMANASAKQALFSRTKKETFLTQHFSALQEALGLTKIPNKIECFDVSHALGEATVVACVVFDEKGPLKSHYRRFNMRTDTNGNDLAALTEGLTRHYTRLKAQPDLIPEVLIIDGGRAQLSVADQILETLEIKQVKLLSVAKGESRKVGLESIYASRGGVAEKLELDRLAFQLVLQCRDEAHRFAITAHRAKRAKRRVTSTLEEISGIGNKRRQNLLHYFGGLQEVLQASVEELAKVPGINLGLAIRLYQALHGS